MIAAKSASQLWKSSFTLHCSRISGGSLHLHRRVCLQSLSTSSLLSDHNKKEDESAKQKQHVVVQQAIPPLPLPHYYVPKAERRDGKRKVYDIDYMVGETRLARNSRTCPTRELYFLHTQWQRHKSPYRKLRHMANLFRAAPFQRLLFPDLLCITTVAGCLTYYNECIAIAGNSGHYPMLAISASAFAGATTAIGLLAGFRLNTSYGRYTEGRKQWSDVSTTTRNLARQTKMWMNVHDEVEKMRLIKLCQAFPVTLIFHLNDKGCHHNMKRKSKNAGEASFEDRVKAEFQAELYDVYRDDINDADGQGRTSSAEDDTATTSANAKANANADTNIFKKDFDRLCHVKSKGGNVPLEVLTCMGETIAGACNGNHSNTEHDKNMNKLNPFFAKELDKQVQSLCQSLGGCEKVVKTPLPTGFTRHSSRLLFIWSNFLPFALYPLVGPFGTLPTVLLTAYAVLGIEDISVQLEEPFDILPLRQYSDSMFDGLRAIEQNYKDTP
jgi:predicted membrane chloride channel (bestrophin family)